MRMSKLGYFAEFLVFPVFFVVLTVHATNVGSRRIIEKNGGVLENQVLSPKAGVDKLRFWVDIR